MTRSERHPYCHRESLAAYPLGNLAAREPVERQRHPVCVSVISSLSPSVEAPLTLPACRRSCDRACGASRFGSIHADIAAELALASSGMTTLEGLDQIELEPQQLVGVVAIHADVLLG